MDGWSKMAMVSGALSRRVLWRQSIRLFRKAYKGAAEFNFGLEVTEGSLTALKVACHLAPEASLSDG